MGYALITPPSQEPITLQQARMHLKEPPSEEDALIETYISAAREMAEAVTNRKLITQTWELYLDRFPCGEIEIPFGRLQSVVHVKYLDVAGVQQTMSASDYVVDAVSEPGRILPAYAMTWPITREQPNAVTVRFICGYGAPENVPWQIKAAMLLMISHWYVNREPVNIGNLTTELPLGINELLSSYRIMRF